MYRLLYIASEQPLLLSVWGSLSVSVYLSLSLCVCVRNVRCFEVGDTLLYPLRLCGNPVCMLGVDIYITYFCINKCFQNIGFRVIVTGSKS